MKRILFIYAVTATAAAAVAITAARSVSNENRRLRDNSEALAADIEHYRTRLDEEAASVQALRLRCDEFETLCSRQRERIRTLGIRLRNVEAAAVTSTLTHVDTLAAIRDTVILRDTLRRFRWHDRWVAIEGEIAADTVRCRVESRDTLFQIVHRARRRRGMPCCRKVLRQEIVSSNPHTHIVYAEYVTVERRRKRQ